MSSLFLSRTGRSSVPNSNQSTIDQDVAAVTIQKAYRDYKHRKAVQPENHEISREDFSEAQWDKFKVIASDLQKSGHYVFAHAAKFPEHALFADIRTYLESKDPAFKSSWNTQRALRDRKIPLLFSNTKDYLESPTCKIINNGFTDNGFETDGFPNNRDMLSVDGYLDNKDVFESAFYFYNQNSNEFKPNEDYVAAFLKEHLQTPSAREFFQYVISKWNKDLEEDATRGWNLRQGRLYLIAISKETLENPTESYVWRSHPYGKVCKCNGEHTLDTFVSLLKEDQAGKVKPCVGTLNPQYRILTANLKNDPTKKILALDSVTSKQKKIYQDFMWPVAHLIRNFRDLEALSSRSSNEEIVKALLRINFKAPIFFEDSKVQKQIQSKYQEGLKSVLRHKMLLLATRHSELKQLEKESKPLEGFLETFLEEIKKLDLLKDFEAAKSLYEKYPSEMAEIRENGLKLKDLPEDLKNNCFFVLEAAAQNPEAVLYAGSEIQETLIRASVTTSHLNPEDLLYIGAKSGDSNFINSVVSDKSCRSYLAKHPTYLIQSMKIAREHDYEAVMQSIGKVGLCIPSGSLLLEYVNEALSQGDLKLCGEVLTILPNHSCAKDTQNCFKPFSKVFKNGSVELINLIISKFPAPMATLICDLMKCLECRDETEVLEIIESIPDEVFNEILASIDDIHISLLEVVVKSPRFKKITSKQIIDFLNKDQHDFNLDRRCKKIAVLMKALKSSNEVVFQEICKHISDDVCYHIINSIGDESDLKKADLGLLNLIFDLPYFKNVTLDHMDKFLMDAIFSNQPLKINALIEACSDGENPKCAIYKKALLADADRIFQIIFFSINDKRERCDNKGRNLFEILLSLPCFGNVTLDQMDKFLMHAISSNQSLKINALMEACSDGENPKCAISKKALLDKVVKEGDRKTVKALFNAGVLTYTSAVVALTKSVLSNAFEFFNLSFEFKY